MSPRVVWEGSFPQTPHEPTQFRVVVCGAGTDLPRVKVEMLATDALRNPTWIPCDPPAGFESSFFGICICLAAGELVHDLREGETVPGPAGTLSQRKIWPAGPWDSELELRTPFVFATKAGLSAQIVRDPLGYLCGYVAVPEDHPWFGKEDVKRLDVLHVHGGVGFAGSLENGVPRWWFGFDAGHVDDAFPAKVSKRGTYRTIEYMAAQCEQLAAQLAGVVA